MSSVIGNGASTEYHIIDGQQRLTTVSLLLLAIRNLIRQKKISAQEDRLDDQINDRFLVSPWAKEDDKIKLRPVKSEYYPSKVQKAEWQWRTPFKTSTVEIAEELSKEAIFAGLDGCLKEIQNFEVDLKQKLGL